MSEQIVTEATARELMRKLDMLMTKLQEQPAGGGRKYTDRDLCALFSRVFGRYRGSVWDVAQLRADGLVDAADTRALGRALSGAVSTHGGFVDCWRLQRFESSNRGRAWMLERRL